MHFIETLLKEPLPPVSGIRRGFWGAPSPGVYILVDVSSTPVLTQSRAHKATATHSGQRAEWHSHPDTNPPDELTEDPWPFGASAAPENRGLNTRHPPQASSNLHVLFLHFH